MNTYEVRTVAGPKAVLMRRMRDGDFVDEATFESSSTARQVARVLNEHRDGASARPTVTASEVHAAIQAGREEPYLPRSRSVAEAAAACGLLERLGIEVTDG